MMLSLATVDEMDRPTNDRVQLGDQEHPALMDGFWLSGYTEPAVLVMVDPELHRFIPDDREAEVTAWLKAHIGDRVCVVLERETNA